MRLEPQQRVYVCFFLFAVSIGALLSRLPDLQDALAIDKSELGLTLIGAAIGALISLTFASPIVARLGARRTAFITVLGTSASLALVPWMGAAPLVFAVLFCEGLLAGALEINLNVEIDRIEAQLGRGVMDRAHGFWSLGFFVTALVSSAVRQAGIPMQLHLALTFAFVLVVGSLTIAGMRNTPARPTHDHVDTGHIALPTLGLLPLCVIGIAAFLVEGAGIDWSAIYMRDVFHVEPFIGGLGLTLFTFFMALARLFADRFVDRFGSRSVALFLLLLSSGWRIAANCIRQISGNGQTVSKCSIKAPDLRRRDSRKGAASTSQSGEATCRLSCREMPAGPHDGHGGLKSRRVGAGNTEF